jgi:hypothetical protein
MAKLIAALLAVALLLGAGAVAVDSASVHADVETSNMTAQQEEVKDDLRDVEANTIDAGGRVLIVLLAIAFLLAGIATLG